MGFRFRRIVKIFPGVHLNMSKTGFSVSIGGAPLTFNFGRGQSRVTTSVPGTGMSYEEQISSDKAERPGLLTRLWRAVFG